MTITEVDGAQSAFMRAIDYERSIEPARTGLHLSTITDSIVQQVFRVHYRGFDQATIRALQELGNTVEEIVASTLRRQRGWLKPDSRTVDGVTCSPDGYLDAIATIYEMKATWSQWTDRETFFNDKKGFDYILRTKGYCYAFGCRRVKLDVLFVRGAKGGAPLPLPKPFILTYTDAEVEAAWAMFLQHAKDQRWLA